MIRRTPLIINETAGKAALGTQKLYHVPSISTCWDKMRSFITATVFSLLLAGTVSAAETPKVRLQTNLGDIVLELDSQNAPATVKNFLDYVESGFYDGTIFHRVIDGFMIQGGGFTEDMARKQTGAPIQNEADNGLKNVTGSISMARTRDPHSATSQFFINVNDNTSLDHTSPTSRGWGYAVFGRVVEGMDVVNKIRQVPTTAVGPYRDVPASPVQIKRAVIETAKSSEY